MAIEQKALVLAFTTKDLAGGRAAAEEMLNRHLAEGWRLVRTDAMGGAGSNDYHSGFASIALLERGE
ncbi:MAG: hypothetical protein ACK46X_02210 [Candidatus Sericytochromatia bacterium]